VGSVSLFSSGARTSLFSPSALSSAAFPDLGESFALVLGSVGQVPLVFPLHCVCLQGMGVPNRALVGLTPERVQSRWGRPSSVLVGGHRDLVLK
jgi:hypothetical protein